MKCEFCEHDIENKDIIQEITKDDEVFIFIDDNKLFLEVFDLVYGDIYAGATLINYCPMCGRELL